ncbi:aminotransferase class I/II-fold pyridoxal phosphate-dependent enzyme [Hansschlegelia quercus]|uniref:Aminotransferase class I/II-fold pyridoxal phosphate-dependent enzyme n=1 Tax=Hansschlegelia quercus TaxID=2528245 RepID=A0A4Q9GK71_9HYPH|nr:aminotransferase class I/II-fold pyridoxal phosphate-dependent enzyme [Hansschlegelia quercus]TBN53425.1 aminotransferase class I/II-fold pyridoxal phosphate-dependent enzyme [Hansschlegelia quercus]
MAILDKFSQLAARYDALKQSGGDPFSIKFDDIISSVEGVVNGKRTLLFGTNNYLGLTFDPVAMERSIEAIRTHGTGTTGSRIANGSYREHERLERELADFYGRKHCMVFSTGYQANLAMISTLVGKDDHLIIDADSHASIYDASRLGHAPVVRFRHNNPDDLAKRLARLKDVPGEKLIVAEGIYSMLGDTAPLKEFVDVKREFGAYLMVDEAHSMGVLGQRGRGLAEREGVEDDVDFVVGTFSKSLASVGGFCVSSIEGFEILRLAARPYMFTASLPPAVISSTISALETLRKEPQRRQKLRANSRRFYDGLKNAGFTVGPEANPIVAVILNDAAVATAFWRRLVDEGMYLNLALPPATPNSSAFLRSSVSAAHTNEHIDFAIELMTRIGREFGILPDAEAVDYSNVTQFPRVSAERPGARAAKAPARRPAADVGAGMA